MQITIKQLRHMIRESLAEMHARPASLGRGLSPDKYVIHQKFLDLRDENGEVKEDDLARSLGVSPDDLDYNGTGLCSLKVGKVSIVSELL